MPEGLGIQSSVKFSIFRPIEGQCFLSGWESGLQELQPFEQEMKVVAGCGEHGLSVIEHFDSFADLDPEGGTCGWPLDYDPQRTFGVDLRLFTE